MPHSPQTLVPSSPGTTSSGPKALAAHPTWCLTPRKPLFLRRRAPRFRGQRRRRRTRRGASLPANPCSFVAGHHVFGAQSAGSAPDVVPHSPQTLVPSSPGTTFSGPKAPATHPTWCFTPRKPLFLRRRAPRFWGPKRRQRTRRGASLPANPCSFVTGHHVFEAGWVFGGRKKTVTRGQPSFFYFFYYPGIPISRNPYPASNRYLQPRNADLFLPPSASGNPAGILPRFRPAAGWSAYS